MSGNMAAGMNSVTESPLKETVGFYRANFFINFVYIIKHNNSQALIPALSF